MSLSFPQLISHACFLLLRATYWKTEGRKTPQKLTQQIFEVGVWRHLRQKRRVRDREKKKQGECM
jgi:hypothetical protein